MDEKIKVFLPKLGESIVSATIVQWFKQIGDSVNLDEPLLEVSTDKVNSEIPSPAAGILQEIHAPAQQELSVGDLLAVILASQQGPSPQGSSPQAPLAATQHTSNEMKEFFSPALLRLAREKGISLDTLEKMKGTGAGGRVTKQDIESYRHKPCPAKVNHSSVEGIPVMGVERLKMSGMRKAIAENMVRSFYEAPHATLVAEVDVTRTMQLVQQEKEAFFKQHSVKLTITSFIAHAIARALQEFPLINSSLEDDTILVKKFINLGIAVSIEQGLVVPVIRHCERLGVTALAKAISEVSQRARESKLSLEDLAGGTITLTNFGMTGVQIGVPIIRHPEVAIVGIGTVHKKVVPLQDDVLAIRQMVYVSLTFDHRVLDGMYGCGFLGALKKHLEEDIAID